MENSPLKQLGLSENQILVYEELLKGGTQKASQIAKKTPLKRGLVYKTLEDLEELGLVVKEDEEDMVSLFSPIHPNVLKGLAEQKVKDAQNAEKQLETELGPLLSMYNLANNKPGVEFYEGVDGLKKALNSIINEAEENSEIISFVKVLPNEFEKNTVAAFSGFIKKRIKKNVFTRVIAIDDKSGRKLKETDSESLRKTRLTKTKKIPLDFPGGEIFIYKNKIFSTTIENGIYLTLIIQSDSISQMLSAFFESEWELLS